MKTTACVQLTPAVLIFASFFFFARGCCNCLLATSRQRHKNAEKFVACCVRAAQLAKLATCFTACNEFMHRRLPPFLTCSTLNRISFNCTFFKCLVNVFFSFFLVLFFFKCFSFRFFPLFVFMTENTQPKSKPVNNESNLSCICLSTRSDFFLCPRIGLQFVGQVEK